MDATAARFACCLRRGRPILVQVLYQSYVVVDTVADFAYAAEIFTVTASCGA